MSANRNAQYQTCYKPESHGIKYGHRPGSDRAVECMMLEHHMERKMEQKTAEAFGVKKTPWQAPPSQNPKDYLFDAVNNNSVKYDTSKEQVLIITRGLPASGKTTWAKQWLAADPNSRMRINRDSLRETTYGQYVIEPHQEKVITEIQKNLLKQYLFGKYPKSVIMDDTFLRSDSIKTLLDFISDEQIRWVAEGHKNRNIKVLVKDFPLTVDEAVARNQERVSKGERAVPDSVVEKMAKRYQIRKDGNIQPVSDALVERVMDVAYSRGPEQYKHDDKLKDSCYLVDIDGTLALIDKTVSSPRSPYDYTRVIEDKPNTPVIEMVKALKTYGHKIVIMSGREDSCRTDTEEWLKQNNVPYEVLFMRKAGDQRKDSIIKWEMYSNNVKEKYNVNACIDDRNQVVEMYRSRGFKVFQVAPGDF